MLRHYFGHTDKTVSFKPLAYARGSAVEVDAHSALEHAVLSRARK
jgi:hypothetical protein